MIYTSRKTYFLDSSESQISFSKSEYSSGNIYVNATPISQDDTPIGGYEISQNEEYLYTVYFDCYGDSSLSYKGSSVDSSITYEPNTVSYQGLKRIDKMIDDDTSFTLLRANPKLTGNVKVVVDSDSNMYLDIFKVSLGLSQNKYRHIPINPDEYYGRTLMAKMKSMPPDDFYKVEQKCYELFAISHDLDEQYYDKYNYGVRTNKDNMYKENFSLLAPLCIRKTLPDFFLIFKVNNSHVFETSTSFLDFNNSTLVKSFDMREGTKLGKYIRNIHSHNKGKVGYVYVGYDYDKANIFNGISLDKGAVTSIYEATSSERQINNQVSMNNWYTLGYQRNHMVCPDIVNFEFMFDDPTEDLFSIHEYFGVYVRVNEDDETFTCIGVDGDENVFDSSNISGQNFDASFYPELIYGITTPDGFIRLKHNIWNDDSIKSNYKLTPYNWHAVVNSNTIEINTDNGKYGKLDGSFGYVSMKLNDTLDPGEHFRIIDMKAKTIYEVFASNYFDEDDYSEISHSTFDASVNGEWDVYSISMMNINYRSLVTNDERDEIIAEHVKKLKFAFEYFNNNNIIPFCDEKNVFSLLYCSDNGYAENDNKIIFEKVSSICGYSPETIASIVNYNDKSFGFFGKDSAIKIELDPSDSVASIKHILYPNGFENLGKRVCYSVAFCPIKENMLIVDDDVDYMSRNSSSIIYKANGGQNDMTLLERKMTVNNLSDADNSTAVFTSDASTYGLVGFGNAIQYVVDFGNTYPYILEENGKVQIYQNYPLNHGICSIFPIKDIYTDVIDSYNNISTNKDEQDIHVSDFAGEYAYASNAFGNKNITVSGQCEEFIGDYIDEHEEFIQIEPNNPHTLDSTEKLGNYLNILQNNGHNTLDIPLIFPYCCKWRIVGTDHTGNRMRVMYPLNVSPIRETVDFAPLVAGNYNSYWVPGKNDNNIGFLACDTPNIYSKYVSSLYDTENSVNFRDYIRTKEGRIDDLLYNNINSVNKFSKVYGSGDNSIEFVSGGVRIRLTSNDKVKLNLSEYIGYSGILIMMSGNHPTRPCVFDILFDENCGQMAVFVYGGIRSDLNMVAESSNGATIDSSYYQIRHYTPIAESSFDGSADGSVLIKNEGNTTSDSSVIVMYSVPQSAENEDFVMLIGKNTHFSSDSSIRPQYPYGYKNGSSFSIDSDASLEDLHNNTNNVNMYLKFADGVSITSITKPLTLEEISKLTSDYTITVKQQDGRCRDYTEENKILDINIIESYNMVRENQTYNEFTSGNVQPSFAVPVYKDILNFLYTDASISEISEQFDTCFDGCNIMPSDINAINQMWIRKFINIEDIPSETDAVGSWIFKVHQITKPGDSSIDVPVVDSSYTFKYSDFEEHEFKVIDSSVTKYDTGRTGEIKYKYDDSSVYCLDSSCVEKLTNLWFNNLPYFSLVISDYYDLNNHHHARWERASAIPEDSIYVQYKKFKDIILYNGIDTDSSTFITNIDCHVYDEDSSNVQYWGDVWQTTLNMKKNEETGGRPSDSSIWEKVDLYKQFNTIPGSRAGRTVTTKINGSNELYLKSIKNWTGDTYSLILYGKLDGDKLIGNEGTSVKYYIEFVNGGRIEFKSYTASSKHDLDSSVQLKITSREDIMYNNGPTEATVTLKTSDKNARITSSGTLQPVNSGQNYPIYYDSYTKTSEGNVNYSFKDTCSMSLIKNLSPTVPYWFSDMCRVFTEGDVYNQHLGIYSGYEKNKYIGSRGITIHTNDASGNTIEMLELSNWKNTVVNNRKRTVNLSVTLSLIELIKNSVGFSTEWNSALEDASSLISDSSINLSAEKYIENSILPLININEKTLFTVYVNKNSNSFEFDSSVSDSELQNYEVLQNVSNVLYKENNKLYMSIENLDKHKYCAKMTIKL